MPRDAEGSLTPDQVYAVTAFLLYKNDIVKESDVLDAKTLLKVQMPNRAGFFPAKPEATAKNGNWKPNWNQAKPSVEMTTHFFARISKNYRSYPNLRKVAWVLMFRRSGLQSLCENSVLVYVAPAFRRASA